MGGSDGDRDKKKRERGRERKRDAGERERRSKTEEREITGLANMKIAAVFLCYEETQGEERILFQQRMIQTFAQLSDRANSRCKNIFILLYISDIYIYIYYKNNPSRNFFSTKLFLLSKLSFKEYTFFV